MKIIVQSLWIGNKLSRMEYYSILSFLKLNYIYHLYTYEHVENIPAGTIVKDGNEIMPKNEIFSLKSTFLPFSDIFRYKMLYEKGNYWVDLDMIAIKKFDFKDEYIFSSERTIQKGAYAMKVKFVPNIGVLKAPKGSKFYLDLYNKCLDHAKKGNNKDKIKYMRMLRDQINSFKYKKYVKKPEVFCNLDWWNAKDAFMDNCCKGKFGNSNRSVNSMFNGPYTVHFWRDLATKKYNLDLDAKYSKESLWEKMIHNIENKKYVRSRKKNKLNRKRSKRGGTRQLIPSDISYLKSLLKPFIAKKDYVLICSSGPTLKELNYYVNKNPRFLNKCHIVCLKDSINHLIESNIQVNFLLTNHHGSYNKINFGLLSGDKKPISICHTYGINKHNSWDFVFDIDMSNNIMECIVNNNDNCLDFDRKNSKLICKWGHIMMELGIPFSLLLKPKKIIILGWDLGENRYYDGNSSHIDGNLGSNNINNASWASNQKILNFTKYLTNYVSTKYNVDVFKLSENQKVHLPIFDITSI